MVHKKTIIISSLLSVLFLATFLRKPAYGQGTFSCVINHSGACINTDSNCSSGFREADCSIWRNNPEDCSKEHVCITEDLAASCTTKLHYISCPSDFPVECEGKFQCCRDQTSCERITTKNFSCDPGTGNGNDGNRTAIGCIPINNLNTFVGWTLGKLIFIASGIAFLLMVVGAFQILTSAGTPEKVKAGKELITSALTGLIFIILSMFILKLIGVDILHLPDFAS